MTILQAKNHLTGMLHGGTLKKVRNIYNVFERAANNLLSVIHPVDSIRKQALSNTVHDDIYNYSLPSDFREIIDLLPQDTRETNDMAGRRYIQPFDLNKAFARKTLSIESNNASKIIRINWRSNAPKTVHAMDDFDNNGTWTSVGTASGIEQDTITKYSGAGSVRFDLAATDDGIQITDMSDVDLTDEDEAGDFFGVFYIKDSTDLGNFNSWTPIWGNDLTAKFWTGIVQTAQADGTAFKVGWNIIRIPWSTATETGAVAPATIDSFKLTADIDAAISDIRVDNIVCSRGRNFDIKYYSNYLFKNSAGTWIEIPTTDNDTIILDKEAENILLYLALMEAAHQIEGSDSTFDINYAEKKLGYINGRVIPGGMISKYNAMHPSMVKKAVNAYGSNAMRRKKL